MCLAHKNYSHRSTERGHRIRRKLFFAAFHK